MIDLDEHLFISLGGPAPSSGARLKPVWLAITGNRDELGLQLGDQGPGSPAAEGGRPAIGLIRNGDRVFGGRVSFGQGGGASVRTSLPMPHAGRPAPTASGWARSRRLPYIMRGSTSPPATASRATTALSCFLTRVGPRCTRSGRRGAGAGHSGRTPERQAMLLFRSRGFVGVERPAGKPKGPAGPTAHRAASPRFAAPPMAIITGADPNKSYTRPKGLP